MDTENILQKLQGTFILSFWVISYNYHTLERKLILTGKAWSSCLPNCSGALAEGWKVSCLNVVTHDEIAKDSWKRDHTFLKDHSFFLWFSTPKMPKETVPMPSQSFESTSSAWHYRRHGIVLESLDEWESDVAAWISWTGQWLAGH